MRCLYECGGTNWSFGTKFIPFPSGWVVDDVICNALVFLGVADNMMVKTRLPAEMESASEKSLRSALYIRAAELNDLLNRHLEKYGVKQGCQASNAVT